jgi:hypothetical protein
VEISTWYLVAPPRLKQAQCHRALFRKNAPNLNVYRLLRGDLFGDLHYEAHPTGNFYIPWGENFASLERAGKKTPGEEISQDKNATPVFLFRQI